MEDAIRDVCQPDVTASDLRDLAHPTIYRLLNVVYPNTSVGMDLAMLFSSPVLLVLLVLLCLAYFYYR